MIGSGVTLGEDLAHNVLPIVIFLFFFVVLPRFHTCCRVVTGVHFLVQSEGATALGGTSSIYPSIDAIMRLTKLTLCR